jgi:hypothetical protein
MVEIIYPTVEEIQYNNTIAIEMFRRSKRDQAKTISVSYTQKEICEWIKHGKIKTFKR